MVVGLISKFGGGLLLGKRSWKQRAWSFVRCRSGLGSMGCQPTPPVLILFHSYISPPYRMMPCGQEDDSD